MIKNILLGALTVNVDAVVSWTDESEKRETNLNWLDAPERFTESAGEEHKPLVG